MRYELKHLRSPVYDLIKILACLLVAFEIRLYSRLILGLLTRTFTDVWVFLNIYRLSLYTFIDLENYWGFFPSSLIYEASTSSGLWKSSSSVS